MRTFTLLCSLIALSGAVAQKSFSQCTAAQTAVTVTIIPDDYGSEITWNVKEYDGTPTFGSGGPYTDGNTTPVYDTVCVTTGSFVKFTINDGFGDGICCSVGNGSYTVKVDGAIMASGGQYAFSESTLFMVPPVANDAGVTAIDLDPYIVIGSISISGTLKNFGTTTITSVDLHYSVNNGTPVTTTLTGLNIASQGTYDYTHPTAWVSTSSGIYTVKVWTKDINGNTDLAAVNDTTKVTPAVAYRSIQRLPMIEEFSSSTCSPCAAFNAVFDPWMVGEMVNTPSGTFSAVKYQMNWPSPGTDPSYNANGNSRKTFYGVSGIPDLYIDAINYPGSPSNVQPTINERLAKPSVMDIIANHTITGNTVSVTAKVVPFVGINTSALKLFFAVVEDNYFYTGGTTSQEEFHQIMRKMLPGSSGVALGPVNPFDIKSLSQSSTFTIANPPAQGSYNLWIGMSNIHVICWAQNSSTKELFQSSLSTDCSGLTAAATVIDATCGNSDGSVAAVASNGTAPYTWYWDDKVMESSSQATGLPIGSYSSLVIDANRCFGTVTATVKSSLTNVTSTIIDAACGVSDGSIALAVGDGTAPYTYSWSNSATSSSATGLQVGTYTVTVTDASGCTFTNSFTVANTGAPDITAAVTDETAGSVNGAVNVTVSGGATPYTYGWSNGSTTEDITALAAGSYTLTITDASGCVSFGTYSVSSVTVGVNEFSSLLSGLFISPNPASDFFQVYFETKGTEKVGFTLKNVLGQVIVSSEFSGIKPGRNFIGMNTSQLTSGVYFVELNMNGKVMTEKVLVQNQ